MAKSVLIEPQVRHAAGKLEEAERKEYDLAVTRLGEEFGQPHLHAGLDIRKLHHHLFECRAGLHWRLAFLDEAEGLRVVLLGTHEEIHQLVHSGRYD
jgi:hypothetical protein